ncbi:MAG: (2Fe-2S)-binding protein [Desulfurococcaceae archaeon]|uniref:(2Fe-2S)-binding protein n=1 Tax=Staphylothermus marinus TaxID=2280 RepID=A0A7C4HDV0_STAMA
MHVKFTLNNKVVEIDVKPNEILLDTLRYRFGLKSVKRGCERGECGVCTVLLNDNPVYSCMVLTVSIDGSRITTIEGLIEDSLFKKIINSFTYSGAIQCGYCTPGFIITTYALLKKHESINRDIVIKHIEGNLCRCTGYKKIIDAIINASK